MKALVLAAGSSTRLRPLTNSLPKALLPIGGKTILDHQIEALVAAGIGEMTLVVGFQKEKIIKHIDSQHYPIAITYLHNDKYQTTGPIVGGLLPAVEHLQGPLLFFHCDVLFDKTALPTLLAHPAESAMLVREGHWDEEAGKVVVGPEGRVRELGKHIEQGRATGEYLQVAKFGQEFCKRLKAVVEQRTSEGRDGYTIDAFNDVVADGSTPVTAIPFGGVSLEIDTPEDYAAAQASWKD